MSKILKEVDAVHSALNFNPQKFPVEVPTSAEDFMKDSLATASQGRNAAFKMNELIADQIGVAEREQKKIDEKVEQLAIEKFKEAEEKAYKEAYELGEFEGKKDAFEQSQAELEARLDALGQMIESIGGMKKELYSYNESHLIQMVVHLASKIAMQEITTEKEAILPIIEKSIEHSQAEEKVTVKVSNSDYEFLLGLPSEIIDKYEFFKKSKLEPDDEIQPGGCIVETNYGTVDSTIEQRLERLWASMNRQIPAVKDQVG